MELSPSSTPVKSEPDPEEYEERVAFEKRLERFREKMAEFAPNRKADMMAYAYMRKNGDLAIAERGKHPPGVRPSQRFSLRAELAISGVHRQLIRGIDTFEDGAANAIVISGYYECNEDSGSKFTYSGEGGLINGVQKADQDWVRGNESLRNAFLARTPVKVVRGIEEDGKKKYVYEGLYRIIRSWRERRGDFYVCLFNFRGIEEEYVVSGKVKFNPKAYYRRLPLAVAKDTSRKRPRKDMKSFGTFVSNKVLLESNKDRIFQLKGRKGLLKMDISEGKEALCIPLFNDVDDDHQLPEFRYITGLVDLSPNAERIVQMASRQWTVQGCQRNASDPTYCHGLLLNSCPEGIRECGQECADVPDHRVVMKGVRYPLEVYKTKEKGWGVRCSVDIPSGAFICEYIGRVISDHEAEDVIDNSYLYSLDHFFLLKEKILSNQISFASDNMPPLPLSDEDIKKEEYHGKFVVIDAKPQGNVGRFLNHGCAETANVLAQMVMTEGCNGVYHHVAFFACQNIPRMTELCHDYGWNTSAERTKPCFCKGPNCQGHIS